MEVARDLCIIMINLNAFILSCLLLTLSLSRIMNPVQICLSPGHWTLDTRHTTRTSTVNNHNQHHVKVFTKYLYRK